MKSNLKSWIFYHSHNKEKRIALHDENSAENFQSLLRDFGQEGDWVLEGTEAREVPAPRVEPVRAEPVKVDPEVVLPAFDISPRREVLPPVREAAAPPLRQPQEEAGRPYSGQDRRSHPRFETEFRVVLITGSHSFRNTTLDISVGGLRLSKPIPKVFLGRICTIFISHHSQFESAQIHCRVIPDERDLLRIQFVDTDAEEFSRLESWLKAMAGKRKAS